MVLKSFVQPTTGTSIEEVTKKSYYGASILLMLFIFSWVGSKSEKEDGKTAFCYFCSEVHPPVLNGSIQISATPTRPHAFDPNIWWLLFINWRSLWKYLWKYLSRKCSKNCSGPKRTVQRSLGRMKLTSRNKSTLIFHF